MTMMVVILMIGESTSFVRSVGASRAISPSVCVVSTTVMTGLVLHDIDDDDDDDSAVCF